MRRDIHCYVTEEQYAFLKRASAQMALNMAVLIRHALDETYGAWMELELHGVEHYIPPVDGERHGAKRDIPPMDAERHGVEHDIPPVDEERHGATRDIPPMDGMLHGERGGLNGGASGNGDGVDARRYAQAGLVGARGKAANRAADWIGQRTRLRADTLKTLLGAYLVLSRVNSFWKMSRRVRGRG